MVLSLTTGTAEGGAGKKARASSASRICGQHPDLRFGVFQALPSALFSDPTFSPYSHDTPSSRKAFSLPAARAISTLLPQASPNKSHSDGGSRGDQGIDECRGCPTGSFGSRVGLSIGAVVAEEALGVHREGVRKLQAVSEQDHHAKQHRLGPHGGEGQ